MIKGLFPICIFVICVILLLIVAVNNEFIYFNSLSILNGNKQINTNDIVTNGYLYHIDIEDDYNFRMFTDKCLFSSLKKYKITKTRVIYSDSTEKIYVYTNIVNSYAYNFIYYNHKLNDGMRKGILINLCNKRDILLADK